MENSIDKNSINVSELQDTINILSKESNISKWDLGASSSVDLSVQVDNGVAKQLKASQKHSLTIRVWNSEDSVGITSTSDISKNGLRKALKGAKDASQYGNKNESPQFSISCKEPLPKLDINIIKTVGIQKLYELLSKAECQLLNSDKNIDSVPYNGLAESSLERIYLNSDYSFRQMKVSQASIYLYSKAQENDRKPRSSGAIRIANGVKELDINGCIREASSRTLSHLNYQPIDTGKYLVCFTPEAFLDLIGAFSSIFNARSILDGISLSNKESIGQQLSVPELSIYDYALHPSNIGTFNFDGEGTPKQKITLVENGILKNLLHSEATAREFGVKPTGHAGLGSKVSVSPDWFVISNESKSEKKENSLDHITYDQKFILIESLNALHAGVKASQGSFSLPFDGWIVSGREKVSIEAATVAGDIKSVLNNIVCIESNIKITHQGVSPHIWVNELSITGEA
tara:strand:- start:8113 stop:9492 length:1380 start_codon:yes stop_codon:yes gene_type:complete